MSISANSAGGNTTVTITRVQPNAKAQQFLADFINGLHSGNSQLYPRDENGNPVDPATLTNQQKLNILEAYMVEKALQVARGYNTEHAAAVARDAAAAALNTNLGL